VHTASGTRTLVTICLDNEAALEQALPLILSFAAVGNPPSVLLEATRGLPAQPANEQAVDLQQLPEFGVAELYADEFAKIHIDEYFPLLAISLAEQATVRILHSQAHAIYAF